MKRSEQFLLGVINNQIILGEIEIKDWNGYDEFSATFDVGEAFDIDLSEDEIKDWYEGYWDCLDSDGKLDALCDGNRTYQDWLDDQVYNTYYEDIKDCSCTNLEMDFNDITINFETVSCGQCDVREDVCFNQMIFTNKEAFNMLMNLWDNYHIKKIDDEGKKQFNKIIELLDDYNWCGGKKVEKFIRENLKY